MKHTFKFDVIVVGGGHAGIEAAVMSSRLGAKTAVITFDKKDFGTLSCNPAMGGLGKGHLIKEIDAMGGVIGKASDLSGIQFRVLNKTRGEAVQGPRAQIDREKYKENLKILLAKEEIKYLYDEVSDIILDESKNKKKIIGLELKSLGNVLCNSVIVTTGTFLRGLIHQGCKSWSAGRINCKPSTNLSYFFEKHNFKLLRLKTGTPPRLFMKSIDFTKCETQKGDSKPEPFSFLTDSLKNKQVDCHITYTNRKTHNIIKDNLSKSPIFNGTITSQGPRYCPSLEDKVFRFSTKERHQIFLEPESIKGTSIYPNGISTSLPTNTQLKLLRTIQGLENVKVSQYGYTIEYDCIDSIEINANYETKRIEGLFLAGQINGTTGYEEAAAQGLLAGINAALKLKRKSPLILPRSQAYLGVLTSDLTRGGLIEPYRMFTSRAEYRLLLRSDNADERLTDLAIKLGTAEEERKEKWLNKKKIMKNVCQKLHKLNASPQHYAKFGIKINQDGKKRTAFEVLGYKEVTWDQIRRIFPNLKRQNITDRVEKQIKINSFYKRYSERQQNEIEELKKERLLEIHKNINFNECDGLSNEIKEILSKNRPNNIEEAKQLPGMTPAAASILLRYVKK